jgi:hypothetical protein
MLARLPPELRSHVYACCNDGKVCVIELWPWTCCKGTTTCNGSIEPAGPRITFHRYPYEPQHFCAQNSMKMGSNAWYCIGPTGPTPYVTSEHEGLLGVSKFVRGEFINILGRGGLQLDLVVDRRCSQRSEPLLNCLSSLVTEPWRSLTTTIRLCSYQYTFCLPRLVQPLTTGFSALRHVTFQKQYDFERSVEIRDKISEWCGPTIEHLHLLTKYMCSRQLVGRISHYDSGGTLGVDRIAPLLPRALDVTWVLRTCIGFVRADFNKLSIVLNRWPTILLANRPDTVHMHGALAVSSLSPDFMVIGRVSSMRP